MGGVLGANVMRDHNVVFDYDNRRVGFAEGMCEYKAHELDVDTKDDSGEVRGEPEMTRVSLVREIMALYCLQCLVCHTGEVRLLSCHHHAFNRPTRQRVPIPLVARQEIERSDNLRIYRYSTQEI